MDRRTNRDEYNIQYVYDYLHAKSAFSLITTEQKEIIDWYMDKAPLYISFDSLMLNMIGELYEKEVNYWKDAWRENNRK